MRPTSGQTREGVGQDGLSKTLVAQKTNPDLVVGSHAAWKRRNFRGGTQFAAAVTPRRALGSLP
jgi:hypothetical protein